MKRLSATFLAVLLTASVLVSVGPLAASSDCVTTSEYQSARSAWKMEGLSAQGVRSYFGFEGEQVATGP